jgi:Flp pilus assembly pilin Flp
VTRAAAGANFLRFRLAPAGEMDYFADVVSMGHDSRLNRAITKGRARAGQSLVEYALVLTFVSVVSIVCLSAMGVELRGVYVTIIDALDSVRTAI